MSRNIPKSVNLSTRCHNSAGEGVNSIELHFQVFHDKITRGNFATTKHDAYD